MQGPVSATVLCIREIGDPYVILNSFPCGKKSRPLSIIVHMDAVSPPVQRDTLSRRIIQTFPVLAGKEFGLNFSWKKVIGDFFFFPPLTSLDERRGASPRAELLKEQNKGTADHREAGDGQLMRLFRFLGEVLQAWNTRRSGVEWFYGCWLTGSATASATSRLNPRPRAELTLSFYWLWVWHKLFPWMSFWENRSCKQLPLQSKVNLMWEPPLTNRFVMCVNKGRGIKTSLDILVHWERLTLVSVQF